MPFYLRFFMKFRVAIFFLLFLQFSPVFCQMTPTDSIPIMKKMLNGELPPESRIKLLSKLCALYWNIDPDTSLWYGMQGKALYGGQVSGRWIARNQFALGMAWENKGNFDSALSYLCQAEVTSLKAGDTMYHFRTLEQTGSLYRMMGKYDTAVLLMSRSLEYFKSRQKIFQIMSALYNIGSVYLEQNRYNKTLQYYLESASYDSILSDSNIMATHQFGIGTIYLNLGTLFKSSDPEKSKNFLSLSKSYFTKSIPVFEAIRMKTGYCFAKMNLLSVMIASDELSQADSLLASCSECLVFKDPRVTSGFMISRAQILHMRGMDREAMALLAKVSLEKGEIRILPEFHRAMLLYASLLWKAGQTDSSFKVATSSLSWARSNSVVQVALEACRLLAGWDQKSANYRKAFDYLTTAALYQDSLSTEIGRETFDQLELSFNNKILKAEIGKLTIEKKYNKTLTIVIMLVALFIVILLTILAIFMQRRRKIAEEKRLIAEARAKLAEKEKYNSDLEVRNITLEKNSCDLEIQLKNEEVEKLQLEMQLREQDLVYQTVLNASLNQKNSTFTEKLSPFRNRLTKKIDQEEFAQALSEISRDTQTDPLQQFEMVFKQMHGGFLERLVEICPELTKMELQICALLRLNMSSKDIAQIISISPSTVDGIRHRVRKKLNLDSNSSLTTFFLSVK